MLFMAKLWKICVKHRDIKLVSSDEQRKKLVRESNYHACNVSDENFMAIEMRRLKY